MTKYIWQLPIWPKLTWDSSALLRPLGNTRQAQGELLAKSATLELKTKAEILTEETLTTAAIEGEKLNQDSVRSSVARRLGLPAAGLPATERHVDGLVEMLIDATREHTTPLTAARLKGWHAALFPTGYSGIQKIATGEWRSDDTPMQVVSGPMGKEKVHFEAPPSNRIAEEMVAFLKWFNSSGEEMDGLLRAALAHFWFVTIHPFQDGNGRIARAIADMALAQDEKAECRLYSVSAQIRDERRRYYDILERTQRGSGDISEWIIWFLDCLNRAIKRSEAAVKNAMDKSRFWQSLARHTLNDRQRKVINRLFEAGPEGFEGGLTNRKYRGITKTTRETAKRDMAALVEMGLLRKNPGKGRSSSYSLNWLPGRDSNPRHGG